MGEPINEVTYNAAVAACEKGGAWQRAIGVLTQMRADGLTPGVRAYTAAISSCASAGEAPMALEARCRRDDSVSHQHLVSSPL